MNKHFTKKRFGQHFLKDTYYLDKIVSSLNLKADDHIVEIGPGQGALTQYIVPHVARYDAVEIDRDLIPTLQQKFGQYANFHLYEADALTFDFKKLASHAHPLRLIGNLPYNISSPLLFHLFKTQEIIQDMHFLLQKEVVDRLTAPVNIKSYGRLSVMTQYFCENSQLFTIPPGAFSPPPKVNSAFVQLKPRPSLLPVENMDTFSLVVKEAFTYRRKTLGNSLKRLLTSDIIKKIGIDPNRRAETLTIEEFIRIANEL